MAKKQESALPAMHSAGHGNDVDAVITNRELTMMLKANHENILGLKDEDFDELLGEASGAGAIFGVTGGVMEAALRPVNYFLTGENPEPDAFSVVRCESGWHEATVDLGGTIIRAAVASGLANARELIESIKAGKAEYDFVEIMACPGGCVAGGGQPISGREGLAAKRAPVLYNLDKASGTRFAHENPSVVKAYKEFYGKPLSKKSHELLHLDRSE